MAIFLDPRRGLTPDFPCVALEENSKGGGRGTRIEARATGRIEVEVKHTLGPILDEGVVRILLGPEGIPSKTSDDGGQGGEEPSSRGGDSHGGIE